MCFKISIVIKFHSFTYRNNENSKVERLYLVFSSVVFFHRYRMAIKSLLPTKEEIKIAMSNSTRNQVEWEEEENNETSG